MVRTFSQTSAAEKIVKLEKNGDDAGDRGHAGWEQEGAEGNTISSRSD